MNRSEKMTLSTFIAWTIVTSVACDKTPAVPVAEKEEPLPNVQVSLPPAPNFDEGRVAEKWEDGSYSIYGLRSKIDERLQEGEDDTEIMVKGYVQDIYVPPECPEGEMCPPGKQPHFWITDKPDQEGKKRAMMVVNYRFSIPEWDAKRWKKEPEVIVEKGQQYTFKGKFKRFSSTGFAYDSGLLEFVAYKPKTPEGTEGDWVYPPASPWHPAEVARAEEENRKLAERAAKTAADFQKKRGK